MNAAIIFIKENEKKLASSKYLETNLVENTIDKLKNTSTDVIYLINYDFKQDNVIICKNIKEAIDDIEGRNGKTLIISPFYPELDSYHYETLFQDDNDGCVFESNGELLKVYKVQNKKLPQYNEIDYSPIKLEAKYSRKINSLKELIDYSNERKLEINLKLIEDGVNILDPNNTYIGKNVKIDMDTVIYPNVVIEGNTKIGRRNTITSGSHIINSEIGDDNTILSSRIDNSIVHNEASIGPNSHLRMHSEVFDKCRIGNFVEFKNTKFQYLSRCAHLTYLGDCDVGEDVNIGCGVVTVNYDGVHKFHTTIKDHAFVGSNSNLIAPVTVGEYAVIAAGSTITNDVEDKDMAIARSRQIIKEGLGYKYIKKEK